MSLLVFAAVATAAAAAAYATRNWRRAGTVIGFAGLLATLLAALAIQAGDRFEAAGGALEATAYGRLFVLVGLLSATLVLVIARLTAWQRNAPAAVLGGAASLALGLASPEPAIGLLACGGAALVATLVALVAPLTPSRVRVLASEVRGAALGLMLGLAALSLVPVAGVTVPVGRVVAGLALLAAVLAVSHRLASVPFHARASRLAETAPALGLPLLLAWIPAAWAVVLLDWSVAALDPNLSGIDVERLIVAAVAVATVVLATAAALAQDEIEKATAYAVVAGGGFVVLAFAALDPAARDGLRAWLPAFIASAACLTGWTIAIRGAFGTGRVDDLAGWIRRAPVLAVAFVAIAVALLGWPGAVTWDGRSAIVAGVVGGPAPVLAAVAGLVPLLALARLVVVGAARPGAAAIAAPGERPRWGAAVLGPGAGTALQQASPAAAAGDGGPNGDGRIAGTVATASAADGARRSRPRAAGDDVIETMAGSREAPGDARPGDADGPAADAAPDHEAPPAPAGVPDETVAGQVASGSATDRAGDMAVARSASVTRAASVGRAASVTRSASPTRADEPVNPDDPARAAVVAGAGEPAADVADGGVAAPQDTPWRGRAGLSAAIDVTRGLRLSRATVRAGRADGTRAERPADGRATTARYLLEANRVPIRSAVVLLLAVTTLLAAAGAFDLRGAAAGAGPVAPAAERAEP